eukprot:m.96428 g.96428  ORF g.96428 m.96428 type:complete len:66 (+) comp36909_c0_seq8:14-211(+)
MLFTIMSHTAQDTDSRHSIPVRLLHLYKGIVFFSLKLIILFLLRLCSSQLQLKPVAFLSAAMGYL